MGRVGPAGRRRALVAEVEGEQLVGVVGGGRRARAAWLELERRASSGPGGAGPRRGGHGERGVVGPEVARHQPRAGGPRPPARTRAREQPTRDGVNKNRHGAARAIGVVLGGSTPGRECQCKAD